MSNSLFLSCTWKDDSYTSKLISAIKNHIQHWFIANNEFCRKNVVLGTKKEND